MCRQTPEFYPGDRKLDGEVCPRCNHLFGVHNVYGCRYSSELIDQCTCSDGRDVLEARRERDEALKILNRPDVQKYLAWWNATQND